MRVQTRGRGMTMKHHVAAHPRPRAPRILWMRLPLVGNRQSAYMKDQTERGRQASGPQPQQEEADQTRLGAMSTTAQNSSVSTTTEPHPRRLHQRTGRTLILRAVRTTVKEEQM